MGCFHGPRTDKSYAYLPNLAGNQMGQNYDGLLVILKFSASEDKMKFCLLCFSLFRTLIQRKGFFLKLATVQRDKAFLLHQEICGLRTHAIEHS